MLVKRNRKSKGFTKKNGERGHCSPVPTQDWRDFQVYEMYTKKEMMGMFTIDHDRIDRRPSMEGIRDIITWRYPKSHRRDYDG